MPDTILTGLDTIATEPDTAVETTEYLPDDPENDVVQRDAEAVAEAIAAAPGNTVSTGQTTDPDASLVPSQSVLSRRLRALQSLNTKLMCMNVDATSYQDIVRGVWKVIGCDYCALFLHDRTHDRLVLRGSVGYDLEVGSYQISLAETDRIHCQVFQEEYLVNVPNPLETPGIAVLDENLRANLVYPIISQYGPVGVFDFGSQTPGTFSGEELDICSMLVDQMAYSIENVRLLRELSRSRDAVIRGMALLAESRDKNIGGHLDRICASSHLLAGRLLGMPEYQDEASIEFVDTIARAAALHDIGKVGIPDRILLKPGKLNEVEFAVMQTHTTIGADLLLNLMHDHGSYLMIKMGAEVARAHHEWWDGSGYPKGLRGEGISLAARIVALADVYDALTSKRIYKSAWEHSDALDTIRTQAGKQFDPLLTEIFLADPDELVAIRTQYPD